VSLPTTWDSRGAIFHPNTTAGTGELYHRTFKSRIEKVISEAQTALIASPALQNGYQQGAELQRNGGHQSSVDQPQPQPQAPQYGQSSSYGSTTYNTAPNTAMPAGEGGQHLTGSAPHPPLFPSAYQYQHLGHNLSLDAGYQVTSNLHQGPSYGSSMNYQQDVLQQQPPPPQINAAQLNSVSYATYTQVSNQHDDTSLSLGWEDPNPASLWPNVILMQQPQPQKQTQQKQ
jgi:hypothetical protein